MFRLGRKALSLLQSLSERVRRAVHFWFLPRSKLTAEANAVLSGREYYDLYDDVYREIEDHEGSAERDRAHAPIRRLVYADFDDLRDAGRLAAPPAKLVDLGCGDGRNALRFARLGYQVTGADISPTAIDVARRVASKQGIEVDYRVADVTHLAGFPENSFDVATDIGCLHMLVRSEHRRRYLKSVHRVLRRRAVFFLFTHVSRRDVHIANEDLHIERMVTHQENRWLANDGSRLRCRMPGFRGASMQQYEKELSEAGFEIAYTRLAPNRQMPFALFLAHKL
jgi:ubiquinone/menaquinone biosynthesis C-methylase UbiE